jgi:hypothetical protein
VSDNTTLNVGTGGDAIRDIDRGAAAGGASVKTQVVQLDAGGGYGNPESLVSDIVPLPVADEEVGHVLSQILAVLRAQLFVLSSIAGISVSPNEFTNDDDQLF